VETIYLDNNASTKIDERVFAAMRPYFTHHFAHPSSPHLLGTKVREKIEKARDSVAVLLGTSHPDEIVFTSGGSETGPDGLETERETKLCWVKRLRMKEQTVIAVCRPLKSQAWWEHGGVVDAFLDALVMDSEKHQGFLLAVEKTVENLIMNRPQ
jgi:cysteine desulfurase